MNALFDTVLPRASTDSSKWSAYPADVLPMWVADMDFAAAPVIIDGIRERLGHPALGYATATAAWRADVVAYLQRRYGWVVSEAALVPLPGVVPGCNMALGALAPADKPVVVKVPNYPPLRAAAAHWGLEQRVVTLEADASGQWHCDPDTLAGALHGAGVLLLSNPHNPVGKAYSREELLQLAQVCEQQGVLVISDEIHADLLFEGRRHVPIASLGPEIAARTITLMSASKAYNIAGLKTAFAVITDPELRRRFQQGHKGMVDSVNVLGLEATRIAFSQAEPWLEQLLGYLQGNRDWLAATLAERAPAIRMHLPQATYLAWLDCRGLGLDDPQRFFLDKGRVAFSAGTDFGQAGQGFVRLNFGCPRALLQEGVARMLQALEGA
ncbi:MalY/PatB family protein [Pseudomonas typographi]|uniref:cysteine-S-conjugate beta-lyase n=1 Tax=Pseudomonas typographi TaxID=2715964 RepID=A0ABR7Z1I1_9PSED|nr:MalY/PatB family protein [Pseudomonas typographi]MBD1587558.1 pyridoxal phosphate-dependent aminotransferase [Pseudomonas typographi]MBD1599359.1 pyridoxal phosphate-dependent aminotransferase [Pseudomonas typographi]